MKKGFKTGSFFWAGSEVWGRHPDIFFKYQTSLNYFQRCDEVVGWFKKFDMDFATLYFNEPDSTGIYKHLSFPFPIEIKMAYIFSKVINTDLIRPNTCKKYIIPNCFS